MYDNMRSGDFEPLSAREVIEELELILKNADCTDECVLRSNHPSNLVNLRGTLPQDKERLLAQVSRVKTDGSISDSLLRNRYL
jgi:hypothetical protein